MAEAKTIYAALMGVQQSLKAPKDKDGGGRYKYRSAEDILEKVKPLLQDAGLILLLDEEIRTDNVGSYIYSTATIVDIATGDTLSTHSMAREDLGTKVMSPGQATGAAISYARKYCLGGLFLIDNEDDLDSPAYQAKSKPPANANGAQDSMKQSALKSLNERAKAMGISNQEITNIIHRQYNKANSKEMTTNEVADLANNLKKYIDMGMGAA